MDAQRFKDAFERLDLVDQRLTHRLRPRTSLKQPSVEQLAEQMRDVQQYAVDLKEILRELFLAIAGKPSAGGPPAA
jgi:hypothetical protein